MDGQQTFICRDSGDARDCDWQVRDSNTRELLESARSHLQRRHAVDVTVDHLCVLLRTPIRGIGGI